MTINDFFSYSNKDGSVSMYEEKRMEKETNKIYILNNYGKKIEKGCQALKRDFSYLFLNLLSFFFPLFFTRI